MIGRSDDGTIRVLSLSYGKDSLACLRAIEELGLPLDRIVHAEVWATQDIPADLPPMMEFKAKADQIILDRYGYTVEHICATRSQTVNAEREREREREQREQITYEDMFYAVKQSGRYVGEIKGFPGQRGRWCIKLKTDKINIPRYILQTADAEIENDAIKNIWIPDARRKLVYGDAQESWDIPASGVYIATGNSKSQFSNVASTGRGKNTVIQYLGIAADEPERIARHSIPGKELPLVQIGWDEAACRKWCEDNDLLSPIYTTSTRGGCWFCHNQGVGQLRLLRKNYPDLWALLMKWDLDSPVTFKADGTTVHDFDRRFEFEDKGIIIPDDPRFKWEQIGVHVKREQISIFDEAEDD